MSDRGQLRLAPQQPGEATDRPATRLKPYLDPGEQVEWADRPVPWGMVRDRGFVVPAWLAAIAAPLGVVLTLVATSTATHLTGLALLAGAAVVGVLVLGTLRRAGETIYGLTDRRVLVLLDGAIPRLEEAAADRIAWLDVARQRDGTGVIHLTLSTPDGKGGELVLGGLADPQAVARRIVTKFGFHAPHILDG